MPHPFLSEEWIAEARAIRERYADGAAIPQSVRLNLVVTGVPFGAGTVRSYVDTSSGHLELELGELEAPDVTVTTDHDTARSIFVDNDPNAAAQAFMARRIVVQGDVMKAMALQTALPSGAAGTQLTEEIRSITT